MRRHEMHDWLLSLDKGDRAPLWIISYNRPGTAPFLEMARQFERTDDVNVVVRASQWADYERAYPELEIHALPDEQIPSCGAARWGAADLAYSMGQDVVMMFDDDVIRLGYLFERAIQSGPNAGKPASAHDVKADLEVVPDVIERVATAMSAIAEDVFTAHPNAVLGGPVKQHMSFDPKNQATKYLLNGGLTPRQAMVWHLDRMNHAGVRLNLEEFGVHGEDIGLLATLLAAGLDAFALPSLVYDHWPEAVNIERSQIRNAENAAELHAWEWECLQRYPIKDYLRVKTDLLGRYEWGDVHWQKLHKLRGTQPYREDWPGTTFDQLI